MSLPYLLIMPALFLSGAFRNFRQEEINQAANELLKEPFCFIQTSDGKVVSVQHSPDERASIVNLKKGIAAAFQGNFKRTAQEVEEDTQSKHVSHYRLAL